MPLIVEERVIGVLVAATTGERRAFAADELRLMEALAGEAAIALDRTRSASALDEALARERLVAKISRRVRSVHDLDAITRVAVTETGRAIDGSRCFIRLGESGDPIADPGRVVGGRARADRRRGRGPARLEPRRPRAAHGRDPGRARRARAGDPSLGSVEALTRLRQP